MGLTFPSLTGETSILVWGCGILGGGCGLNVIPVIKSIFISIADDNNVTIALKNVSVGLLEIKILNELNRKRIPAAAPQELRQEVNKVSTNTETHNFVPGNVE